MRSDIGRFGIIPEWLLDSGISATAIRLFATLAAKYADRDTGESTPSRAALAVAMGVRSVDTIDRASRELIEVGALAVEQRFIGKEFTSNRYMLFFAAPEKAAENRPAGRMDAATGYSTDAATPGRMDAALTRITLNQNHLNQKAAPAVAGRIDAEAAVGRLCRVWEEATGTTVTALVGDHMASWLERLPEEAIAKAIRETGVNGARAWKYTSAVLERYAAEGWKEPPPKQAAAPPRNVVRFAKDEPSAIPAGFPAPKVRTE